MLRVDDEDPEEEEEEDPDDEEEDEVEDDEKPIPKPEPKKRKPWNPINDNIYIFAKEIDDYVKNAEDIQQSENCKTKQIQRMLDSLSPVSTGLPRTLFVLQRPNKRTENSTKEKSNGITPVLTGRNFH